MDDIRSLDLNLIRALDVLLEERSVTRAAGRLALTQPAVSGMLTRLREGFTDPLLIRTPRGMVPTERALRLAAPIKRVLAELQAMLHPAAFHAATTRMTLTVAATDYALRAVVVPLLAALRTHAPDVRVAVRPLDDDRLLTQFERGDVDIALVTPESTPPDLRARRLFDEEYVCALRRDHPALDEGELSLDAFCALDHAMVSYAGGGFRAATDAALARIGRTRRVTLSVPSFLVLPEVLRGSDVIAVVPRRLVHKEHGLSLVKPPVEVPGFTKVMAWHERTHRDPAHAWVRSMIVEIGRAPAASEARATPPVVGDGGQKAEPRRHRSSRQAGQGKR